VQKSEGQCRKDERAGQGKIFVNCGGQGTRGQARLGQDSATWCLAVQG